MICFRDMTFCDYWRDCKNAPGCHRPLTDKVLYDARAWWGKDGAPIAVFTTKPKCHSERTEYHEPK